MQNISKSDEWVKGQSKKLKLKIGIAVCVVIKRKIVKFFFVKQEDKRSNRKNKTTKTKKVEKAENNGDIMKPRRKFRFFFCA